MIKQLWHMLGVAILLILASIMIAALIMFIAGEKLHIPSAWLASTISVLLGLVFSFRHVQSSITLNEELQKQTEVRQAILNMTQEMALIQDKRELYHKILETAVSVLPNANMGSLMVLDDLNMIRFEAAVGFDLDELSKVKLKLEETYLYAMTKGEVNETIIVENASKVNDELHGEGNKAMNKTKNTNLIETTITSPLIKNGILYGMMNIDSTHPHAFDRNDLDLINFFAGEIIKVVLFYETIEENNRFSMYDPLTDVYNRRYLLMKLKEIIDKDQAFTLVSVDINNLKVVNDTFGHDCGDELLVAFVRGIRKSLGDRDMIARYGGDEFIIVYQDKNSDSVSRLMEESIIPTFETLMISTNLKDVRVSFSYGLAEFPKDSLDFERLLLKADENMYKDKRNFHMKKEGRADG